MVGLRVFVFLILCYSACMAVVPTTTMIGVISDVDPGRLRSHTKWNWLSDSLNPMMERFANDTTTFHDIRRQIFPDYMSIHRMKRAPIAPVLAVAAPGAIALAKAALQTEMSAQVLGSISGAVSGASNVAKEGTKLFLEGHLGKPITSVADVAKTFEIIAAKGLTWGGWFPKDFMDKYCLSYGNCRGKRSVGMVILWRKAAEEAAKLLKLSKT